MAASRRVKKAVPLLAALDGAENLVPPRARKRSRAQLSSMTEDVSNDSERKSYSHNQGMSSTLQGAANTELCSVNTCKSQEEAELFDTAELEVETARGRNKLILAWWKRHGGEIDRRACLEARALANYPAPLALLRQVLDSGWEKARPTSLRYFRELLFQAIHEHHKQGDDGKGGMHSMREMIQAALDTAAAASRIA